MNLSRSRDCVSLQLIRITAADADDVQFQDKGACGSVANLVDNIVNADRDLTTHHARSLAAGPCLRAM